METESATQPSIDWSLSIKLANNNKELARDLLNMFVADLPNARQTIHNAYQEAKYNELLSHVHRLHGASCYCGVVRLKKVLANMEFSLKEKTLQHFPDALQQFDDEVNNIIVTYKEIDEFV